jgi:hypothetical protein
MPQKNRRELVTLENIESDPREERNIGALYEWVVGPALRVVEDYKASIRRYPNAPAANITRF